MLDLDPMQVLAHLIEFSNFGKTTMMFQFWLAYVCFFVILDWIILFLDWLIFVCNQFVVLHQDLAPC